MALVLAGTEREERGRGWGEFGWPPAGGDLWAGGTGAQQVLNLSPLEAQARIVLCP